MRLVFQTSFCSFLSANSHLDPSPQSCLVLMSMNGTIDFKNLITTQLSILIPFENL